MCVYIVMKQREIRAFDNLRKISILNTNSMILCSSYEGKASYGASHFYGVTKLFDFQFLSDDIINI